MSGAAAVQKDQVLQCVLSDTCKIGAAMHRLQIADCKAQIAVCTQA